MEVLVAAALGALVLAAVGSLALYGTRSSMALTNYTDLDAKSRHALDLMSRQIREATAVTAFETNLPTKSLTLTDTRHSITFKVIYDSNARTMVFEQTGQPDQTVLRGCDRWDFSLFQRTPHVTATNVLYYPATNSAGMLDPSLCKLINMSWKCSRTIMGQKANTETVQTAQIVLRNKQ